MRSHENGKEKDLKILNLLNEKIEAYFKNQLYISDLIYDLENLLNQFVTLDEKWKKNFRTLWLDVEVAYSISLDEGLESLSKDGKDITKSSLCALKKSIENKSNELKKQKASG